jgi:hypothetical protein
VWAAPLREQPGDGTFGDLEVELEEFGMDSERDEALNSSPTVTASTSMM